MLEVIATEFKLNLGYYLKQVSVEDIWIKKNGKTVAKLTNPNVSAVDSISGILKGKVSDETYIALGHILDIVKVLTVTNDDVNNVFLRKASDFEDCLPATCAKSNKCNGIVTRKKKIPPHLIFPFIVRVN